jgi:hypothetical protein
MVQSADRIINIQSCDSLHGSAVSLSSTEKRNTIESPTAPPALLLLHPDNLFLLPKMPRLVLSPLFLWLPRLGRRPRLVVVVDRSFRVCRLVRHLLAPQIDSSPGLSKDLRRSSAHGSPRSGLSRPKWADDRRRRRQLSTNSNFCFLSLPSCRIKRPLLLTSR